MTTGIRRISGFMTLPLTAMTASMVYWPAGSRPPKSIRNVAPSPGSATSASTNLILVVDHHIATLRCGAIAHDGCDRLVRSLPFLGPSRTVLAPLELLTTAPGPLETLVLLPGRMKAVFPSQEEAQKSAENLKARYPLLQVKVYDAAAHTRARVQLPTGKATIPIDE